jgi:hypothetical protein
MDGVFGSGPHLFRPFWQEASGTGQFSGPENSLPLGSSWEMPA